MRASDVEFDVQAAVVGELAGRLGLRVGSGVGSRADKPNARLMAGAMSKSVALPPNFFVPDGGLVVALEDVPVTLYYKGPIGPFAFGLMAAMVRNKRRAGVELLTHEEAVKAGGADLQYQAVDSIAAEIKRNLDAARGKNQNLKIDPESLRMLANAAKTVNTQDAPQAVDNAKPAQDVGAAEKRGPGRPKGAVTQ